VRTGIKGAKVEEALKRQDQYRAVESKRAMLLMINGCLRSRYEIMLSRKISMCVINSGRSTVWQYAYGGTEGVKKIYIT
jgi:hypothetical protein